jgi:hypothetical protein
MGRGATATLERLAASIGELNEAMPRFAAAVDISKGGVLLALPALLVSGLLRHAGEYFRLPKGFYGLKTIFLLLAFMTLARLRSMEALRYYAPGEWGKLLGLDRAPEVRTLRLKLKHLADQEQAFSWSAELCKEWMLDAPDEAAVLYVDGHVRVYHGKTKKLPKHYVARERLCLSATADYWVNSIARSFCPCRAGVADPLPVASALWMQGCGPPRRPKSKRRVRARAGSRRRVSVRPQLDARPCHVRADGDWCAAR